MSVLRRSYIEVEPTLDNFDNKLTAELRRQDPGGKAGKQIGGQLNRALKRLDLEAIDVKADPKAAFAAIEATEERLRSLSRDSATVEVKVRTEKGLSELRRFKRQLGDVGGDAGGEAALGFGARFSSRLGPVLASLPIGPGVATAGLVMGAALAPSIAAGIGAALAAGAGAAAIGGGIALIAKDPEVVAGAKKIGTIFAVGLTREAVTFRQPVLDSFKEIEAFANRSVPKIGIAFRNSSPAVVGLTKDILLAGDAIVDSFVFATGQSAAPLKSLGGLISAVGAATGDMIGQLSQQSAAGASAIDDLTNALVNTVHATTTFLTGLAQIKSGLDGLDDAIDSVRFKYEDQSDVLDLTADGYKKNSEAALLYRQGVIGNADSVNNYNAYLRQQAIAQGQVVSVTSTAIATDKELKAAQEAVSSSQKGLADSLAVITSRQSAAQLGADTLRSAMTGLYGATIRQSDANETFQASWDALSTSVATNKRTLDIHTAAGRANRDALEGLITSTNDAYIADIAAGTAIDLARRKHDNRIKSIEKEAAKLGLDRTETQKLIATYGKIPKDKTTQILLEGVKKIASVLTELYVYQRSLAEGIPLASARAAIKGEKGPAKRFGGFAEGGWTGPGSMYEPAGVVHADEFVIRKESRREIERKNPGLLEEMNATGQMPGYATGGLVAPVETRGLLYRTNLLHTKILSRAAVAAKVLGAPGSFGNWPSSPAAQRGDSGVWRRIVALIKSTGPFSGHFGNAYRAGDPKWHGSGRAVDWMGFNQDRLASFLAARRPLELIHRTKQRDYAYTRGKNKGSFNESLMNAHRNHVHVAMDDGGYRMLQPGLNVIPNGTGRPEPIAGPAAMAAMSGDTYVFNFPNAVITAKQQMQDLVVDAIRSARKDRKL